MDLGEQITLYRKQCGMTIDELAQRSGVPKGTITKIIGGVTKAPTLENIRSIAYALGKTLNDFDDPSEGTLPFPTREPALSREALQVARDYTELDQPGKSLIRVVLAEEGKRIKAELERRRERELFLDTDGELGESKDVRVIPFYLTPAAAGYTSPVFGEDFDYIEVDGATVPRQADFAVKIDGDSMEPYIMDGATVYVNRDPLADGDVGIFCLDGDMLCKQYHKDAQGEVRLLSLNRARADADRLVSEGSTLSCFGRVILPHQLRVQL